MKTCPFHALMNTKEATPLRRATKEVKNTEQIIDLLNTTRVGYLGLVDEEGTYVVPLNFTWYAEKIYFHGAEEGRKAEALKRDISVCFTIAQDHGTIAHPVPAETGTAYMSAMIFGTASKVTDLKEATAALQSMLDKYVPGYFNKTLPQKHVEKYRSGMGSATAVYRIEPTYITVKADIANPDQLFYLGRTQEADLKR